MPNLAAVREQRALLQSGYDLLQQGVSVFDANLKLVACNKSFQDLRDYPARLCQPGVHISDFIRHNAAQGRYGTDDVESKVQA